jgi:hypothetical protein
MPAHQDKFVAYFRASTGRQGKSGLASRRSESPFSTISMVVSGSSSPSSLRLRAVSRTIGRSWRGRSQSAGNAARTPTHGYESTREAAMAAFAKGSTADMRKLFAIRNDSAKLRLWAFDPTTRTFTHLAPLRRGFSLGARFELAAAEGRARERAAAATWLKNNQMPPRPTRCVVLAIGSLDLGLRPSGDRNFA